MGSDVGMVQSRSCASLLHEPVLDALPFGKVAANEFERDAGRFR
jgi:hypothetical protein